MSEETHETLDLPHSHHPHRQPAAHREVVELPLAEQQKPGARRAEPQAAVREAVGDVVGKQIERGLDIINDGEQSRTTTPCTCSTG